MDLTLQRDHLLEHAIEMGDYMAMSVEELD